MKDNRMTADKAYTAPCDRCGEYWVSSELSTVSNNISGIQNLCADCVAKTTGMTPEEWEDMKLYERAHS